MLGENLKYLQLLVFKLQQSNNIDVFKFFQSFFLFFLTIFKSTENPKPPKVQTRSSDLPEIIPKKEDYAFFLV